MAYLREIVRTCYATGCERQAVVELMGERNASHGVYCQKHGEAGRKHLQQNEDEYHAEYGRFPKSADLR